MADIKSIDGFGDNPIVTWDDGVRIPLVRNGSLWIPSRKHTDTPDSGAGTTAPDSGTGVVVTAAMIKAGCDAGDYPNPTSHDQGGYQGVADMFNDAIAKTHSPTTKKQAACLVGECCQETGGFYYWEELGGSSARYAPYYGRGYIQLTWQDNYASYGTWMKKYGHITDAGMFVSNPGLVATKEYVAPTGIWEFDQLHSGKTLWQIADSSSSPWTRVSRAINTGNPDSSFPAYGEALRAKIIDAVLAVTPDPQSSGSGNYGPFGDDYPYKNDSYSEADPWAFYKRECVSFACWRVRQHTKRTTFSNSYAGVHWGNAGQWISAARSAGIPVSSTPRPGDVACRAYSGAGHVAWVSKVSGTGFDVEEYNHDWSNGFGHVYDTRHCSVSDTTSFNGFSGFIRFT